MDARLDDEVAWEQRDDEHQAGQEEGREEEGRQDGGAGLGPQEEGPSPRTGPRALSGALFYLP